MQADADGMAKSRLRSTGCRAPLGLVHSLCGSGMACKLVGRTPWPRDEFAAAVGASAGKFDACAGGAEGALEGADARVGAIGGQVDVAAFAVRSQLEHGQPAQVKNTSVVARPDADRSISDR